MDVRDLSLWDVAVRNAELWAERRALVAEDGEALTFAAVRIRAEALAGGLARAGIGPGDRIGVLAQNSARFFLLYFAAARLGAVLYPFNWRWQKEEITRLLGRARLRAMVVDRTSAEQLPDLDPYAIGPRFAIDDHPRPGFAPLSPLLDSPAPGGAPPAAAGDTLAIIATAAVEAIPRGAMLSHHNLLCSNVIEIAALSLAPADGNLLALPLYHIAGLGHALAFFHAGAQNVVQEKFDAERAVRAIDQHRLTHLSDFPPVLAGLLDAAERAPSRLPSLRWVSGLDSPATMARLHQLTGAEFVTGFGQTETSGFVSLARVKELPGSAGRPSELCRIRIVDDWDRDVPVGASGEILVRGPLVFSGYADEPDATAHTFRDGWHHTGDVGRFDPQGVLYYVKRKPEKELIKPGGENVYPAEVETVIVQLAGVRAACVFGVPHPKWGEGIKAVVEIEEGAPSSSELDADRVINFVGERIARFKRPHFVAFTRALPRGPDGGVDRDAVKAAFGDPAHGPLPREPGS